MPLLWIQPGFCRISNSGRVSHGQRYFKWIVHSWDKGVDIWCTFYLSIDKHSTRPQMYLIHDNIIRRTMSGWQICWNCHSYLSNYTCHTIATVHHIKVSSKEQMNLAWRCFLLYWGSAAFVNAKTWKRPFCVKEWHLIQEEIRVS